MSRSGPATPRASLAIEEAKELQVVFMETPANPTLRMTDIAASAEAASAIPIVPSWPSTNTFLGPTFQHPLHADLVIYSGTKYPEALSTGPCRDPVPANHLVLVRPPVPVRVRPLGLPQLREESGSTCAPAQA